METLEALQVLSDNGVSNDVLADMADAIVKADNVDEDEKKCLTLFSYLVSEGDAVDPDDVADISGDTVSVGRAEYRILTESERDEAWDENLESYIDDCLDIPQNMQNYFDREAWKHDARMDGAGHCLSPYDGSENEHGDYYIYRTN